MEKSSSSFQIILAAVVITGTLYLLHRLTKPGNMYVADNTTQPGFNFSVYEKNNSQRPVPVEIVEDKPCYFPDEMLQEFDDYGYGDQRWPGLGANPGYRMN